MMQTTTSEPAEAHIGVGASCSGAKAGLSSQYKVRAGAFESSGTNCNDFFSPALILR